MKTLVAMYDREMEQARAEYQKFVEVLDAVQNDHYRELLMLYYVDGLTREQIEYRLYYCHATVFKHARMALSAVYGVLCDKGIQGFGQG